MATRYVAGCMTGTSIDGIDAALIKVKGKGLGMSVEFVRGSSSPLGTLGRILRPVSLQKRVTAGQLARYALMIGMTHLAELKKLMEGDTKARLSLIALHGQTLYHEAHISLQLVNPHPVAQEFGVPVVFDLRGGDIAAGGEGAPITPLADHILFRSPNHTQAVVNLGGFANFTWLPRTKKTGEEALNSIRGGDICACNQVLDAVARLALKKPYDEGGRQALAGKYDEDSAPMLEMMLGSQADGGRSLGTGDEVTDWVRMFRRRGNGADLARTACTVIGKTIAGAVGQVDRLIIAGGGSRNAALMQEIARHVEGEVIVSDELGVPSQFREAIGMAVLGALARDGVSITLPQVTGRRRDAMVTGCWVLP